jgi:hypothetical protein
LVASISRNPSTQRDAHSVQDVLNLSYENYFILLGS